MKFIEKVNKEKGTGIWTVIIENEEWNSYLSKAKKRILDNLEIKGFRKGKVPQSIANKHITEGNVLKNTHYFALTPAYNFAIGQKNKAETFGRIRPIVKKLSVAEYVLELHFDLKPEINIKKYTGFNIPKKEIKVTKEEQDREIAEYTNKYAMFEDDKGPIKNKNWIIFDFKGYIDDVAFPGGEGKKYELEIGSKKFIDGFEEQLIGMKKGDEKSIKVTFPADYAKIDLQNKTARFDVKIHEVKTKKDPELTEELIIGLNIKGVSTLEQFKNFIKKQIKDKKEAEYKDEFLSTLFQKIAKDSNVIIPESIIKKEIEVLKKELEDRLTAKNINIKTYKQISGLTDDDIETNLFEDAKIRIEGQIIKEHILNNEKITVDDKEVEKEYETLAERFNIDVKMLKDGIIKKDRLINQIKNKKLNDFLYKNN